MSHNYPEEQELEAPADEVSQEGIAQLGVALAIDELTGAQGLRVAQLDDPEISVSSRAGVEADCPPEHAGLHLFPGHSSQVEEGFSLVWVKRKVLGAQMVVRRSPELSSPSCVSLSSWSPHCDQAEEIWACGEASSVVPGWWLPLL